VHLKRDLLVGRPSEQLYIKLFTLTFGLLHPGSLSSLQNYVTAKHSL
jgi:hypothetical protein